MRLAWLDIQRLPGIEPGFRLDDLSGGVNIVTGPNAVGKSSLVRALEYLIGGARAGDPPALSLAAEFVSSDAKWTVRRSGREVVWEKNGEVAEAPILPAADQLYCYWLCMEDLLRADSRDEHLLSELRRLLSGGYDLDGIRNDSDIKIGPRHGQGQAKAFNEARKQRREIEVDYKTLRSEEERLPDLTREISEAEAAVKMAVRLEQALALLAARRERESVEAGLAAFPENMKSIRGNEFERLRDIEGKRAKLRRDQDECKAAAAAARERLEASGLASGRPDEVELNARERDIEEARFSIQELVGARRGFDEAVAAEQSAIRSIGGQTEFPSLDPASLSEVESLAAGLQRLRMECDEFMARLATAPEPPAPAEVERHREAVDALRSFLATGEAAPWSVRIAALSAIISAIAATVIGFAFWAWISAFLALVAAAASGWVFFKLSGDQTVGSRARFARAGLQPPEEWSRVSVETRLNELEPELAELRDREARSRQARELKERLAAAEMKLALAEEEKSRFARRLGFDPALAAGGLDRLVRLAHACDEARRKRLAAEMTIARLDAEIEERAVRAERFLERWSAPVPDGDRVEVLSGALQRLRRRCREAADAERDASLAEREIERIKDGLATLGAEEEALFKQAGARSFDRDELARCCDLYERWRQQTRSLDAARVIEATRRGPLEGDSDLLAGVDAADDVGLRKELLAAKSKAGRLDASREEITRIRERLDQTGRDGRLEDAAAAEESARLSLDNEYERALLADVARFLLDTVQEEYRGEHEPEVLMEARDRFGRFTHHAFDLQLDSERGFIAFDRRQQARRSLAELSSGTRMQLLLAMRLAWSRRIERGRSPLPLFLDEALTISDEERFASVVEAIEQVARDEGRQIFYLSARRHEIMLWEKTAGKRPHVIDLAEARFGKHAVSSGNFVIAESEAPAKPSGDTPEEYAAALRALPIDPRRPAEEIHIFHILRDDLPLLRRLMEDWRVRAIGQLDGLLAGEARERALLDRELLSARRDIARAWVAAWREGRGKPVDRLALEDSGAVSERFISAVADLAERLNGDGRALIGALRNNAVAWFRAGNIDQLDEWLVAEGFIDQADQLDADGRARRVLMESAGRAAPKMIQTIVGWLEAGWNGRAESDFPR